MGDMFYKRNLKYWLRQFFYFIFLLIRFFIFYSLYWYAYNIFGGNILYESKERIIKWSLKSISTLTFQN